MQIKFVLNQASRGGCASFVHVDFFWSCFLATAAVARWRQNIRGSSGNSVWTEPLWPSRNVRPGGGCRRQTREIKAGAAAARGSEWSWISSAAGRWRWDRARSFGTRKYRLPSGESLSAPGKAEKYKQLLWLRVIGWSRAVLWIFRNGSELFYPDPNPDFCIQIWIRTVLEWTK